MSYLDIPSRDPRGSADFYRHVFGWSVEERPGAWAFQDGTGHVIGHFLRDRPVSGGSGVLPYVYVANVKLTLARALTFGGTVRREPFPVGELLVAVVEDPSGTAIGLWQRRRLRRTKRR